VVDDVIQRTARLKRYSFLKGYSPPDHQKLILLISPIEDPYAVPGSRRGVPFVTVSGLRV
jgi:hypothetical protein